MKKYLLPLVCFSFIVLSSCEVTIGDTDKTEKEVKNGFSYDKKKVTINGLEKVVNNKITAGEYLLFEFVDVLNATQKEGFQHVGISIVIKDSEGNVLEQADDLLGNIEQQDINLDYYKASYGVPIDMIGKELIFEYAIFDKYGTVKYDFNETYEVVDQDPPVTKGITFDTNLEDLDLVGQVINDKFQCEKAPAEIEIGDEVYFYINGVKGFNLVDNELQSQFKLWFTDENGNKYNEVQSDLNGDVGGLDYYPLYFSKMFDNLDAGDYVWHVLIEDDNSDKFVGGKFPITIQ